MCRVCEREYFGALIFVICVSTERHRRPDKRDERSVRGACEESAPDQFVVFAERKAAQRIQGERAPRAACVARCGMSMCEEGESHSTNDNIIFHIRVFHKPRCPIPVRSHHVGTRRCSIEQRMSECDNGNHYKNPKRNS